MQLFARNVLALLELLIGDDGSLALDFEDEVVAGACVVRDGEIVNAGAKAAVEKAGAPAGPTADTTSDVVVDTPGGMPGGGDHK